MTQSLFSIVALAVALLPAGLDADLFRAAAGRVDITPPRGLSLWGYSSRETAAAGVLDSLYARVLVLDDGTTRLAICTLDLGRTFGPEWMATARKRARSTAGVEQVFFFASHTHSGPVIEDNYPDGKVPPWELETGEKVVAVEGGYGADGVTTRAEVGAGERMVDHAIVTVYRLLGKLTPSPSR